jgi:hypothetical protein
MELAGRALSESHPAGRDQVHLPPHHRTPVQVFEDRPGYLHQVAPCLVASNARGSGVPAISRMAACPTQSSEPGTEPVTDTHIDECGVTFATESVDTPFPRDEPMLRRGIQTMPRRPRKVLPVLALRIAVVVHFRHLRSFPAAQPCSKVFWACVDRSCRVPHTDRWRRSGSLGSQSTSRCGRGP